MATLTSRDSANRFGALDTFSAWWRLRSPPERIAAIVVATLVIGGALWFGVWQPLQRDTDRLTRQLEAQRITLDLARRQVNAMAGLERATPPLPAREPRVELDAAVAALGLKATAIDRGDDGRLRVTFDAIAFDALVKLLDSLQHDGQLRAVDLVVTARVEPGQVRADMTLAR